MSCSKSVSFSEFQTIVCLLCFIMKTNAKMAQGFYCVAVFEGIYSLPYQTQRTSLEYFSLAHQLNCNMVKINIFNGDGSLLPLRRIGAS